jgi:glycosyltransferase involved in cell wall biosynthesis
MYSLFLRKLNKNINVFFFPHINLPFFPPVNSVLTIHDFRPFTKCWDRNIYKKYLIQFLYFRAMHSVQQIVCISRQTQNSLYDLNKRLFNKSKCIYEFVDNKFFSPTHIQNLIDLKYILFVGTRKKHKNILFALKNFTSIKDSVPHMFVLAGKRDSGSTFDDIDAFISQHNLENRVIQYTSPTDDEIVSLYQHADLFVFPSLFEGFGLPPLEAVACGCPAILSDIPIFREIFGDSGLYFSPHSEGDLSALMMRLLMDETERSDLLAKQKERLKLFDRDKIVASYIELFESVAR